METTSERKKLVRPKRVKEKVVVKYIEHNGWEQEIWRNYYVFDYSSKLIKQFEFLEKFLAIFDEKSKVYFNLAVRRAPYLTLRRTHFELKIYRKLKDDEKSLRSLQKESHTRKHGYKNSHLYSFSGKELPHYREITDLLKKHEIFDGDMFKQKLEELFKTDDVFEDFQRLFYKKFGDYEETYGKTNKIFETESESSSCESDGPFAGGCHPPFFF